ncbi:hypothetical protein KIN20_030873 [Parelaphostrongylus tenuis]|uniref:Uncharacterized protein n=1 Tax=Parelaphostrongylus tenuis TaxID=148309 RepID=A0AAD5R4F8_PARTN|nr:hypothetical protein KIN20_030873 [Parelaphostrongylus tenuis]
MLCETNINFTFLSGVEKHFFQRDRLCTLSKSVFYDAHYSILHYCLRRPVVDVVVEKDITQNPTLLLDDAGCVRGDIMLKCKKPIDYYTVQIPDAKELNVEETLLRSEQC